MFDLAIRDARMNAQRFFATQEALKMVPPPANRDVRDLNLHIRSSLGLAPKWRTA